MEQSSIFLNLDDPNKVKISIIDKRKNESIIINLVIF